MKTTQTVLFVALLVSFLCTPANAQGPCREIHIRVEYGASVPGSIYENFVENGSSMSFDLGLGLTQKFSAGFHFGHQRFTTKYGYLEASGANVQGQDWKQYVGALYGEYNILDSSVTPFVGGHLGMHFNYIEFNEPVLDFYSQGNYAFGYGISVGLKYRLSERIEGIVRFQGEESPNLETGYFYNLQVGATLLL